MKVLVTGGTGFTGDHLCAKLVKQGHQVRALVRESSNVAQLEKLNIDLVRGDLCKPHHLGKAVGGVDIVFHIAALFRQQGVSTEILER